MSCAVCGSSELRPLLRIPRAPVFCNQVCQTREQALGIAMASIALVACDACGHVYNADFDGTLIEYSPEYENSLHFSARFESFADELVARLDARLGLAGKTVVEVGCGRGDFLKKLCAAEGSRGYGFDKSYPGLERDESRRDNVLIRAEHYTEAHANLSPDLVCCRHVLEHIEEPTEFLRSIRRIVGRGSKGDAAVYFEVPNALYTLRDGGIWDILYEHCGYFTEASLAKAFELGGFCVDTIEHTFSGQFLSLFGNAGVTPARSAPPADAYRPLFEAFGAAYSSKLESERLFLSSQRAERRKVVVWGAGTKGTMYLNSLGDLGRGLIEYIVDINPRKWGKFVPGSGQEIVSPEVLGTYRPDTVVIMNPAYRDEIRATLAARGLEPSIHAA
jgi:SAM-dependent methyltransferase